MTEQTRDERLASVLEEMIAQDRRGDLADPESVFGLHPDIAHELRELWATISVAEDCAQSGLLNGDNSESPTLVPRAPGEFNPFETSAESLPGTFGDYELQGEIGRGGMGVVFKARQKSLDRTVALKMILHGDFASTEDRQRFRTEAESAARLEHPHIVPVFEVGEIDDRPYFSMRFIEGRTLAQRLAEGPMSARESAELLLPICRAVAEAHRRGILHRDLKPSNILIDNDGRPYVSDFGLAKRIRPDVESQPLTARNLAGTITQTGAIVGTPGYMAPEQAAGRRGQVGVATDVYSLGALLYAMLTGRAPFQAATPVDTVLMVLEQEPPLPRLLNRNTDPELEMIALKCLQKPADLRYPSADALADDLQAYLAGEPISARSSRFLNVISRAFRETHHAPILENWGVLWMWHSLVLLILCVVTNAFQWFDVESRWPYAGLWCVGLSVWAGFFWNMRRRAGPTTFVERQIAHVWAGSVGASMLLFAVELLLNFPVLTLSPVLGVISGMVFLAKAGILSGRFYLEAGALFLTGLAMAVVQQADIPNFGITLFGLVSAASFFFPGLKYYRQRNGG